MLRGEARGRLLHGLRRGSDGEGWGEGGLVREDDRWPRQSHETEILRQK